MATIGHVPAVLIHGRHDVSSPVDTAWDLHRAWPASRLVVLDHADHGGVSMGAAIVSSLAKMRALVGG